MLWYLLQSKVKIKYDFNLKDNKIKLYKIISQILSKKNNIPYQEHNYYINYKIIEEYNIKPIIYIRTKISNYNYLIGLLK